jgi:outer membrane protein OmpA-like peptidoglycan-associated protein
MTNFKQFYLFFLLSILTLFWGSTKTNAQPKTSLEIVVNSNQDGEIQADNSLTLREAISLVNGDLSLDKLSTAEKALIKPLSPNSPSRISFNLPRGQTIIRLKEILPALRNSGLVIDGTTQPGYDPSKSATAEIAIPIPVVEITPENDTKILRGLTILADRITVRGLSIYGFGYSPKGATLPTPPGDILIAKSDNRDWAIADSNSPNSSPKDILIEQNWLGLPPNEKMPTNLSSFGVSVFDSEGTTINRNRIANHQASGIITSYQAKNLLVTENIIVGNGVEGMPDAIRLEGMIENSQINGNLICGNDGSGVYLFKPQGSVQIRDNQITFNGRRLRRAAVYLMGDNNQVVNNQIRYQSGPGIVVTAYPKSDRNIIEKNRFTGLEGLSIDLNTQQNVDPIDFQIGDGPNPPRNSPNRRKETANSAINAPQFNSTGGTPVFFLEGDTVKLTGIADPGSTVEIYRVIENTTLPYGPLSEPLTRVTTDEQGQFSVTLSGRIVKPGDKISAIATISEYGTSEPARNALVRLTGDTGTVVESVKPQTPAPICTTPPAPPAPPTPPTPPTPPPPQPLRLRVPRVIHFALDQSTISPQTARVLDQIAAVMIANPVLIVELQGHTDPRASDAYNLELGNRRALATRNYLLRRGVAPERMTIRSFGERQRRTTGSQRIDYARDRRVEFVFKDVRGIDIIFEEQETDLQLESNSRQR